MSFESQTENNIPRGIPISPERGKLSGVAIADNGNQSPLPRPVRVRPCNSFSGGVAGGGGCDVRHDRGGQGELFGPCDARESGVVRCQPVWADAHLISCLEQALHLRENPEHD